MGRRGLPEYLAQGVRQPVDVLGSIERSRADAHCALGCGAEGSMDVRSTMQSRANGDFKGLVEDATDFRRGQARQTKA
jgi:hypothetical protein